MGEELILMEIKNQPFPQKKNQNNINENCCICFHRTVGQDHQQKYAKRDKDEKSNVTQSLRFMDVEVANVSKIEGQNIYNPSAKTEYQLSKLFCSNIKMGKRFRE